MTDTTQRLLSEIRKGLIELATDTLLPTRARKQFAEAQLWACRAQATIDDHEPKQKLSYQKFLKLFERPSSRLWAKLSPTNPHLLACEFLADKLVESGEFDDYDPEDFRQLVLRGLQPMSKDTKSYFEDWRENLEDDMPDELTCAQWIVREIDAWFGARS